MKLNDFYFSSEFEIEYLKDFSSEWFRNFCSSKSLSGIDRKVYGDSWKRVIPQQCYAALKIDGHRIAYGRGVIEKGYVGIYGVFVDKKYRRLGYGEILTKALMAYGKEKGCHMAYLQVEDDNPIAVSLYEKIGFEEQYQYWYLIK